MGILLFQILKFRSFSAFFRTEKSRKKLPHLIHKRRLPRSLREVHTSKTPKHLKSAALAHPKNDMHPQSLQQVKPLLAFERKMPFAPFWQKTLNLYG
jgi:hypothetical protein